VNDKDKTFEAKITSKINLRKKLEGKKFIEEKGFAVRLINGKEIGFDNNKTNSLIFLEDAWQENILPIIGEIVILSRIKNMGKNKKGKDKFRALCAISKPFL